jgi:pSer/pThr/pTyr-binding forkhead associated (FHA) protein
VRLVIEDQAGTRTVVPFSDDEIVVGRGAEGTAWRLPDRNVSRRHARFTRASGTIFVEDLGSLTGTRVNGERISSRRRVRPGDLVEIGAFDLVVLPEDQAVAGPGAPPPLPAITRPDPMPVVEATAAPGDGDPARSGPAGAVDGPGPGRLSRLVRVGITALGGGVLLGVLLRRLLT